MPSNVEQRYMRPIEEAAIHKETFQINGQQFTCHESYYEGELLNGVDLKIKEMRGLDPNPHLIDYLRESQELVFSVSSSIVLYNTHKKTFHHLLNVEGEVTILKTRLDKTNNKEYIMWVERQTNEREQEQFILKKYGKGVNNAFKESRLKKKLGQSAQKRASTMNKQDTLLKTLFSGYGDPKDEANQSKTDLSQSKTRKVTFGSNWNYTLKVYDYAKREYVFMSQIKIDREVVTDIFLFCNEIKVIGYITQDPEIDIRYVNYTQVKKIEAVKLENKSSSNFKYLELRQKIEHLMFNHEESCYLFSFNNTFYRMGVHEHTSEETHQITKYLEFSSRGEPEADEKPIKLTIKQQAEFQSQILDMSLNDQYLAILTSTRIHFHSAFDSQSLIFISQIEETGPLKPLGIEFNKSILLVTHRESSSIKSYQIRNKTVKLMNETMLQLTHCKQIVKLYCNAITSEIFCIVNFYELGSRSSNKSLKKIQEDNAQYVVKPAFIDVSASYLSTASKTQTKILKIGKQKFKKLHSCPWMSQYLIQTEDSVYIGTWKETFEAKRCIELHPIGIFLVVCLKDAFKIYMITFEGLVNTYRGDSINDIQNCAISTQGNHLAISNNSVVFIYDFYSCTKLRTFNLPLGVSIESIYYSSDFLCCCLKNKKLYIYNSIEKYKEMFAFNPKAFISEVTKDEEVPSMAVNLTYQLFNYLSIHSIFYDPVFQVIIFSAKSTIYFYNCLTAEIIITVDSDPITCFYYCQNLKVLFMGTDNGEVICFPWPNKPSNLMADYKKHKLHRGSVVSILVSSDLKQLVTLGDDNSLSICYLTFVKNLKRMQGLQLIEYMGPNIQINFDTLQRRGFYQYTHTQFNSKLDLLKDYEQQTMNLTFMMPQQRMKQKEQMLSNVTDQTFQLTSVNNKEYEVFGKITSSAKGEVSELKQNYDQFLRASKKEKEELKRQHFEDYIEKYNASERAKQKLALLASNLALEKKREREERETELKNFRDQCQSDLKRLEQEYTTQKASWCTENNQQLKAIDEQKQEFIEQNIQVLEDVIDGFKMSNGSLTCKNNNVQKDITQLKKKIEEHKFLLYRLRNNTDVLNLEQKKYENIKGEKETLLDKEDKVNLVEIEKRYIKQTKILIERDKQINVKIIMHDKEQNMLIHLERCLESIQQNIEQIVQNLLGEKKQSREQTDKMEEFKSNCIKVAQRMALKKKDTASANTTFNNYIYKLSTVADQLISDRRGNVMALLKDKELLSPADQILQKKEPIRQQPSEDVFQTELVKGSHIKISRLITTSDNWMKDYRKLKTEGDQTRKTESSELCKTLKSQKIDKPLTYRLKPPSRRVGLEGTTRMEVEKNSKKVIFRQREEQKYYERIQTEQVVYENSYKKINKENQDLIESYNSLALESKKIVDSLRRQKMMNSYSVKRESVKNKELSPTPFQNYLKSKARKQKPNKIAVPASIYQF